MSQKPRVTCKSCSDEGRKCEPTPSGQCRRCIDRALDCKMPASARVKVACDSCRSRRRKCERTAGAKCEYCDEHDLICITTDQQREARRESSDRRHPGRSMTPIDSDSEASFNSLFDERKVEPESECESDSSDCPLARKAKHKSTQTKNTRSPLVLKPLAVLAARIRRPTERTSSLFINQSGYKSDRSVEMPVRKKQRFTPPSQITSHPTTPQRKPSTPAIPQQLSASAAPLAKMVSSHKALPKLLMPQPPDSPKPLRQTQETSPFTASTIKDSPTTTKTKPRKNNPPISATPTLPSTKASRYRLSNTTLRVHLAGSKGYKPLLLSDCLNHSTLFPTILGTWSLPPNDTETDTVTNLHITFPWLPDNTSSSSGRLMILDRQSVKAGLVCLCDEVDTAPCWPEEGEERRGHCSVHVTIVVVPKKTPPQTTTTMMVAAKKDRYSATNDDCNPALTRDGRSIPHMSVDANRVYWAMRANGQADAGMRVGRIAEMVAGMDAAGVAGAGNELLERGLILITGEEEDYDVWRLSEGG